MKVAVLGVWHLGMVTAACLASSGLEQALGVSQSVGCFAVACDDQLNRQGVTGESA